MGGRGASRGGSGKVDLGFGYTATREAVSLRMAVNKALGVGDSEDLAKYGLRLNQAQGRSLNSIMKEDKQRLKRAKERAAEKAKSQSAATKKFINASGEATTRDITSSAYKRAQRRQAATLMRYIGG